MGVYAKTVVMVLVTLGTALLVYLDDGAVSAHEWLLFGGDVLGTIGVYLFPNKPKTSVEMEPR